MKIHSHFLSILAVSISFSAAYAGTVTGQLQGPSGIPIKNGVLNFNLEQAGLAIGSGSVVPLTASCYTSNDGSVVGMPNPLQIPAASVNSSSGNLPGGVYYVKVTFYAGSFETLPSPELQIQLTGSGTLTISPPATFPPNATGMRVYIGTDSGGETLQGETASSTAQYSQAAALSAGTAPPAVNNSVCTIAFNDTIIPYSGYNVSLTSSTGNAYPGWPQAWQLNGGLNGVVNISSGAPLWNGTIIYPQPIMAQPLNHGPQSISGPLNFTGYNVVNVGSLGVGTSTPSWPIDVENGIINSSGGYLYGGTVINGDCLVGSSSAGAYVPGSCTTGTTLFYQTLFNSSGTAVTQTEGLQFLAPFVLGNNGYTTNVGLAASGVTAGTYTNPTTTVNAQGLVTSIANGSAIPVTRDILISSGICTTTGASYGTCNTGYFSWPSSGFADVNYTIECQGFSPTGIMTGLFVIGQTATGFQLQLQNGTANGATPSTFAEISCHGSHL